MSKARALARAERQAAAARRETARQAERVRAAAVRARRSRRSLAWRRVRLWQHGPSFRRNKESWAALGTLVLVVLLVTYLFTSSVPAVILVGLVLVLASPVLVAMLFRRP